MDRIRKITGPTAALLIIGLAALLMIILSNLWIGERARETFDDLNAARELRLTAATLQSALQNAEASQRGYLLTGNEIYLAPYATAQDGAQRAMTRLKALLGPQAETPATQRLEVLVTAKVEEMTETIALHRSNQADDALGILRSNRGKALMDEANVFLSAIIRTAETRLSEATALQQASFGTLKLVSAAAVLAVLLVTVAIFFIIRNFVRDLRRANDEVGALNVTLEQRVERRTQELAQARDRAEVLLAEVNHRVANSLSMVASMVGMQARGSSEETRRVLADTQARINAVGLVHKKLYTTSDVKSVALEDFLPSLLDQLESSLRAEGLSATLHKELQPLAMPTNTTISLGIIVTEWVTNAFKYAYPDQSGQIRVRLGTDAENRAVLSVEDDGIGRPSNAAPRGTGLGSKLVSAMAASLGGTVEYLDRKPGTEARLTLAL